MIQGKLVDKLSFSHPDLDMERIAVVEEVVPAALKIFRLVDDKGAFVNKFFGSLYIS